VGVNFAKLKGDIGDEETLSGIVAGFFVTHSVINTFGITGKVLFSHKGVVYHGTNSQVKNTLNYLEVPILARYYLNKEGKFRPNLFLGPSFGFLMGATSKEGDQKAAKITNYKNYYHTYDFGLTGGLGLNYEIANEIRILLDARYTYGLSDVAIGPAKASNQTITLSAGVSFGL
jgi:outer membrane protein W